MDCPAKVIASPKDRCFDEKATEEKEMYLHPLTVVSALKSMKGLLDPSKIYRVRLPGALTAVSALAPITTLKASWDASSLGDGFSSFAALFTEYKVFEHHLVIWTVRDPTITPSVVAILVASDPGMIVSGTPTDLSVSPLADCKHWNAYFQSSNALELKSNSTLATVSPISQDGFAKVGTAWTGQTVLYAVGESSLAPSSIIYQQQFMVAFRARG